MKDVSSVPEGKYTQKRQLFLLLGIGQLITFLLPWGTDYYTSLTGVEILVLLCDPYIVKNLSVFVPIMFSFIPASGVLSIIFAYTKLEDFEPVVSNGKHRNSLPARLMGACFGASPVEHIALLIFSLSQGGKILFGGVLSFFISLILLLQFQKQLNELWTPTTEKKTNSNQQNIQEK